MINLYPETGNAILVENTRVADWQVDSTGDASLAENILHRPWMIIELVKGAFPWKTA